MSTPNEARLEQLQEFFDQQINPALAGHGGFAEITDLKEDKLFIRIGGGCQGCAMAKMTVKQGIESAVTRYFPDIAEVVDDTDHHSGTTPYYE